LASVSADDESAESIAEDLMYNDSLRINDRLCARAHREQQQPGPKVMRFYKKREDKKGSGEAIKNELDRMLHLSLRDTWYV
jgi:hypothetical protein